MKKKFNYVYLTTNLINDHQYVGDRSCDCDPKEDKYLGSGRLFIIKKKEYGEENFKKEILEFFPTRQEAFDAQEKYIIQFNTLVPNGYNKSPKGGHQCIGSISKETRNKISLTLKEKYKKGIIKPSRSQSGKHHTKESKKKISESLTGKKQSNETIEKRTKTTKTNDKYWNKGLTKEIDNRLKEIGKKIKNAWVKKGGNFIIDEFICLDCGKSFQIKRKENNKKKERKFCSRSCCTSNTNRKSRGKPKPKHIQKFAKNLIF